MKLRFKLLAAAFALTMASPASAAIVSVLGPNSSAGFAASIIAAPDNVTNAAITNNAMQGFDELQNVLLTAELLVDGDPIAAGTRVSSQMIFLNSAGGLLTHENVLWTFDGEILGTMSDGFGQLEADSTFLLGLPGTTYEGGIPARGLEGADSISFVPGGNVLTASFFVTQPGDWIRVVTLSAVPIPAALPMFGTALGLLGFLGWRRKRKALAAA